MKVTPKGNYLAVHPEKDGFDVVKAPYQTSIVVEVGEGRALINGERSPIDITPGQRVVYLRGRDMLIRGSDGVWLLDAREVMAVLEP